mmetsp:Transcript_1974/g.1887  ORF Transcript_1974/g.1887 Transcript_1974/m.1887 type:complete len:192 (-) Transcript_1974:297-872(-)
MVTLLVYSRDQLLAPEGLLSVNRFFQLLTQAFNFFALFGESSLHLFFQLLNCLFQSFFLFKYSFAVLIHSIFELLIFFFSEFQEFLQTCFIFLELADSLLGLFHVDLFLLFHVFQLLHHIIQMDLQLLLNSDVSSDVSFQFLELVFILCGWVQSAGRLVAKEVSDGRASVAVEVCQDVVIFLFFLLFLVLP